MGRDDEAVEYLDQALQIVLSNEQCLSEYDLITLLFNYTYTGQCDKASLCYNAITCNIDSGKPQGTRLCMALAGYHELRGDVDSAIHYYRQALETMPDLSYTYDAARQLFRLYDQKHDMEKAYQYARLYLSTGDSLDLGGRQQIAATTNNMYQYHRNSERERVLDEEREQASLWATRTAVTCIIVVVSLIAFYLYKRKLHNDTQKDQQGRIAMLEQKINDVEMLQIQNDIMSGTDDTANILSRISRGESHIDKENVDRVIKSIDARYPGLKQFIHSKSKRIGNTNEVICYLLFVGIGITQIASIMDVSTMTVRRWSAKMKEFKDFKKNIVDTPTQRVAD